MKQLFYIEFKNLKLCYVKYGSFVIICFLLLFSLFSCNNSEDNSISNLRSTNDSISIKKVDTILKKNYYDEVDTFYFEELGGWLKIDLPQKEVIDSLGIPEKKDKDMLYAYNGSYGQNWDYKSKGIYLYLESDTIIKPKNICSITIKSPCKLKTKKYVGIGSDSSLVRKKYSKYISNCLSDDTIIQVGSVYGGTIFYLKNGKVTKIFIGAAAE